MRRRDVQHCQNPCVWGTEFWAVRGSCLSDPSPIAHLAVLRPSDGFWLQVVFPRQAGVLIFSCVFPNTNRSRTLNLKGAQDTTD